MVTTLINVTRSTRSGALMEPGLCDSSILLLYHQPHIGFLQLLPLRKLNSIEIGQLCCCRIQTQSWMAHHGVCSACSSHSALEWRPHSHSLQTCHSVRGSVFLLCLLVPAHLALVLFAWAALSWPCQCLIMKRRPKHLPGMDGRKTSEIMESLTWVFF